MIGEQDWLFPIPIVRKDDSWRFDTAAGREEILDRRIGRNELAAIQASLAYVDAQNDYANLTRASTGTAAYAQRIVSLPARRMDCIGRRNRARLPVHSANWSRAPRPKAITWVAGARPFTVTTTEY